MIRSPSSTLRTKGRPKGAKGKTKRDLSTFERLEAAGKRRQCGNCHKKGHNVRKCTAPCGNCQEDDHRVNRCPQPKHKTVKICHSIIDGDDDQAEDDDEDVTSCCMCWGSHDFDDCPQLNDSTRPLNERLPIIDERSNFLLMKSGPTSPTHRISRFGECRRFRHSRTYLFPPEVEPLGFYGILRDAIGSYCCHMMNLYKNN